MKTLNASVLLMCVLLLTACTKKQVYMTISKSVIEKTITNLTHKHGDNEAIRIKRGVNEVARLWKMTDGSESEFSTFCTQYYTESGLALEKLFYSLSKNFEVLFGGTQIIDKQLRFTLDVSEGDIIPVDELFGGYNSGAHLSDDLFNNKIAFITILNFPPYSLHDKNTHALEWGRNEWAYARMGDMFESRIPADLTLRFSKLYSNTEHYISNYNIHCGNLIDNSNNKPFNADMILLSHWGLRDEIKANYNNTQQGLNSQKLIYQVMLRIINQSIPLEVINNGDNTWNPYTNRVTKKDGTVVPSRTEEGARYAQIINMFALMREEDAFYGEDKNTYIKRKFNGEMEVAVEEVETLFDQFLSNPIGIQLATLITQRLNRQLEGFDIWYDGFKTRSSLSQEVLSQQTRKRFPNAKTFESELKNLLIEIGFSPTKASQLSSKIKVDAARGSGHASGGSMRGDKARLRTRIPTDGMDYKGFNIAMHELGHNVEQTISLYDIDHYMLNGVPNTSFTEALAFIFQSRDLSILGIKSTPFEQERMNWYDRIWSLREIMGVSMVDIRIWKWLYSNPLATPKQLQDATISIACDVWNSYFAEAFGKKDIPILAIYSHMVSYPLYLSAYSFGQIIEFQLEEHLRGKNVGSEIERIFKLGRLTPDAWMQQAVGNKVSITPMLNAFTIKQD